MVIGKRWRTALFVGYVLLVALLSTTSYVVYESHVGKLTVLWKQTTLDSFQPERGFAYVAPTHLPELSSHERPSPARILENGSPLPGGGNSLHDDIRRSGRGRYSFWHDFVYFATSDNTDPRTNGRKYEISFPRSLDDGSARILYGITFIAVFGVALLALRIAWRKREGLRRLWPERVASPANRRARVAAILAFVPKAFLQLAEQVTISPRILWPASLLLLSLSLLIYLNRLGRLTPYWGSGVIAGIQAEHGFAYMAPTHDPLLSSHKGPSPAQLLEDGTPLAGPANALHDDIRTLGKGRYSFWHECVYFSASDNADPRMNGRRYEMRYPRMVGRLPAYVLYALTVLFCGLATSSTVLLMRKRRISLESLWTPKVVWAVVLCAAFPIVVIALSRAFSSLSLLHGTLWRVIVPLNILLAWLLRKKFGALCPKKYLAPHFAALVVAYYLLTAVAPNPAQWCRTEAPLSAWDACCTAPDSASYYFGYYVGSPRQPLYPWFIKLVTLGSGFDPAAWAKVHPVNIAITDPGDPLLRVGRVQIFLLLAAGLVSCWFLMTLLRSPLPAILFLFLYDFLFFTAQELNLILTEDLVQTLVLLLMSVFLLFLWNARKSMLPLAGLLCGAIYLTRQAAGYTFLFLVAMILWALFVNWRTYWRWALLSILPLIALATIPDIYGMIKTGQLGAAQENLQYQYRITYALQVAQPQDVGLMPDEESRQWLQSALARREMEHRSVDEMCKGDEYCRYVYYINNNLYKVALPMIAGHPKPAEFLMKIATPILATRRLDYLSFGIRFWVLGLTQPSGARFRCGFLDPYFLYGLCFLAALWLRGRCGYAAAVMILAHLAHVGLTALFAAPIPRMVKASEFLAVVAAFLLLWEIALRINHRLSCRPGIGLRGAGSH